MDGLSNIICVTNLNLCKIHLTIIKKVLGIIGMLKRLHPQCSIPYNAAVKWDGSILAHFNDLSTVYGDKRNCPTADTDGYQIGSGTVLKKVDENYFLVNRPKNNAIIPNIAIAKD